MYLIKILNNCNSVDIYQIIGYINSKGIGLCYKEY